MVELMSIKNDIEKFAYMMSVVLEMEIIIGDTSGNIVGDSERYGSMCKEMTYLRSGSVISRAMIQNETIVFGNAKMENEGCLKCPKRGECHTETIIAYPIVKDNVVYGGIGVYSEVKRQKERLIKFQRFMLEFLGTISDLIITKLEEETSSIEIKAENARMDSIMESLDFALLSLDESDNILYSNNLMKNIMKNEHNIKAIRERIAKNLENNESGARQESRIYLKSQKKTVEYEMTSVPIVIDNKFKGSQVYLKEASRILTKANKLIEPVKSGNFDDIIGVSDQINKVKCDAMKFINSRSNVLIQGESGTGKEMFATAIHNAGNRANGPFVTVNCAAIPDNLLESELFGYVNGAFTGAAKEGRAGKFEIANGGTLFLDEIGELPIYLQPKLLRALQEKKIQRVGSNQYIDIDIRVIAATNRNLTEMMQNGSFREDLYYRLCVIPIKIPPLRERKEDIKPLADYFLERYKNMLEKPYISGFNQKVYDRLESYAWMGNIRELQNAVEYAVNKCENGEIGMKDLPDGIIEADERGAERPKLFKDIEKAEIANALNYFAGETDAKEKAASAMGISRATMYRKIKEYGL